MTTPARMRHRPTIRLIWGGLWVGAMAVAASACGGSSGTRASTATTVPSVAASTAPTSTAPAAGAKPGTMFSTAAVAGLGTVVVDARGHTVYVLTADGKTNVDCNDANGCTKVWPDLPLPDASTSPAAGPGIQASLLSTMKSADGETYPTYHGWLMYEFVEDTAPGQGQGQGVKSFGGTWYALTPAGTLVATR